MCCIEFSSSDVARTIVEAFMVTSTTAATAKAVELKNSLQAIGVDTAVPFSEWLSKTHVSPRKRSKMVA